mmetsp:Transcript_89815/g.267944  ORF Transcript_89815/g.267944 Transcript_89815/m.267944 type:complete len:285 (+) Transcript_89815:96-950(+)
MVFGRFLRKSAEQARSNDVNIEEPKAKWFKESVNVEDRGWEQCQEYRTPTDEDETLAAPPTAPSTREPNEADSDSDWEWDMPGAQPSDDAVGALVVDDYLLVGECSASASASALENSGDLSCDAGPSMPAPQPPPPPPPPPMGDSQAALKAPEEEAADAGLTAASPDEEGSKTFEKPWYKCRKCSNHIFKEEDILSSNYHAMTGPGYLTSLATNVHIALEMQTQTYTTGKYTVREVSCSRCAAMLGVTYAGAVDVRNRYKIGKFLLGRDRLRLPPGVVHPMDRM